MNDSRVTLCNAGDIADGESLGFDPFGEGRDSLFAVRCGSALRVFRNRCPHQGASLPWRKDAYLNGDRTRIVCHAHGAQFDIDTGKCLLGPALGQSLERVDVEIGTDGELTVYVVEIDP